MKVSQKVRLLILASFSAVAVSQIASASDHSASCKNGNNVRRVEITPGEAGSPNGCSVAYFKETENPGVTQVLWSAKNNKDYCKEKAEGFVQKLSGMGWDCTGALAGGQSSGAEATTTPPTTP